MGRPISKEKDHLLVDNASQHVHEQGMNLYDVLVEAAEPGFVRSS